MSNNNFRTKQTFVTQSAGLRRLMWCFLCEEKSIACMGNIWEKSCCVHDGKMLRSLSCYFSGCCTCTNLSHLKHRKKCLWFCKTKQTVCSCWKKRKQWYLPSETEQYLPAHHFSLPDAFASDSEEHFALVWREEATKHEILLGGILVQRVTLARGDFRRTFAGQVARPLEGRSSSLVQAASG